LHRLLKNKRILEAIPHTTNVFKQIRQYLCHFLQFLVLTAILHSIKIEIYHLIRTAKFKEHLMTGQSFCIFVVDDDPLLRMLIVDQLQDDSYQIYEFSNIAEAFAAIKSLRPHLILLDIEMPESNGFELCHTIRSAGIHNVQVIFISGHDNLETLFAALDAGGNDFFTKKSKLEILQEKVKNAVEVGKNRLLLEKNSSPILQNTLSVEPKPDETSIVLHFFRLLFNCQNLQQLGLLLIEILNQFAEHSIVKLSDAQHAVTFSSKATRTALENTILDCISKMGPVYRVEDWLGMNFSHITFLIATPANKDEEAINLLHKHLTIIAEAADVRIEMMSVEQSRFEEADSKIESIKEMTNLLSDFKSQQNTKLFHLENLTNLQHQKLENAFLHLELTDNQKLVLQAIITSLITQLNEFLDNDSQLAIRLNNILNKQKLLLQSL
jgi:DNA-binding response OmpR family regulator